MPVTLADVRAPALTLPRPGGGGRGRGKLYVARPGRKFVRPRTADLSYNWVVVRFDAIDHDEMEDLVTEACSTGVPRRVVDEWTASRASS